MGEQEELLELGRRALLSACQFAGLSPPEWLKEPVDPAWFRDEEKNVGMLAWKTFIEDINARARGYIELATLPFTEKLKRLAERDDLPVYLLSDKNGETFYFTKNFKKRIEEQHGIKLDWNLPDLAREMGIKCDRKRINGGKPQVLWTTLEEISRRLEELREEMSKMSSEKPIDGKDVDGHGQNGHFDENVQNVHEEKPEDGKDENGGHLGQSEKGRQQGLMISAESRAELEELLVEFIKNRESVEYRTLLKEFGEGYSQEVIIKTLDRLRERGLIFEPRPGVLRVVK